MRRKEKKASFLSDSAVKSDLNLQKRLNYSFHLFILLRILLNTVIIVHKLYTSNPNVSATRS